MKLVLDLSATWQFVDIHHAWRPQIGDAPGLSLRITPLELAPMDSTAWFRERLAADLPDGVQFSKTCSIEAQTVTGWPMQLVEILVRPSAADSTPIELRLAAFYRMLDYVAAAVLMGLSPTQAANDTTALHDILRSARPDFRSPAPTNLGDLWEP